MRVRGAGSAGSLPLIPGSATRWPGRARLGATEGASGRRLPLMMYARSPLSRFRTDFSSTSPAVMAFWERSASRPASRAVWVARIRTTKAAASSTAAAVVNNSIRADSDFEIPTWTKAPQRLYSPHRRGEAVDTRVASPLGMPNSALIVIDMINTYDHPDADALTGSVRESLPQMVELVERAAGEDVLIVYVNDNIGPRTS